jgi:uncharacterized membrane protein HdeD (DUF308 family)
MVATPLDLLAGLARNWWLVALRGALAILFAIMAFAWPGLTVAVLVLLFGSYALVDGLFAAASTINAIRNNGRWWPLLVEALSGIGIGIVTFFWPGTTALALLYLIAAWAIITGIFEIVAAVELRKMIEGELLLALAGALSVVFGVLLIVNPGAGALTVVWLIAVYALVFGLLLLFLGFRLRAMKKELDAGRPVTPLGGTASAV